MLDRRNAYLKERDRYGNLGVGENVKMDMKNVKMDRYGSRLSHVAGCRDNYNERSSSINCRGLPSQGLCSLELTWLVV